MNQEVEKLRALLAEARDALEPLAEGVPLLMDRIDAALAEPVVAEYIFRGGYVEDASGDRWWSAELLTKTERERDEARAEVERLRGKSIRFDLDQAGIESRERDAVALVEARAEIERLTAKYRSLQQTYFKVEDQRDKYESDAAKAYERGAETMREAAAQGLDRLLTEKKATAIWVGPDEIRALPIPEDK